MIVFSLRWSYLGKTAITARIWLQIYTGIKIVPTIKRM